MVKIQAFLALETSLATRLSTTASALLLPLMQALDVAIDAEDWEGAERLVGDIDLADVYALNEGYVDYVSRLAMLFGASRVNRRPGTSAVALGFDEETRDLVKESFRRMITEGLTEYLKAQAVQLIALRKPNTEPIEALFSLTQKAEEGSYMGLVMKAPKPKAIYPFESFMDQNGKAAFKIASSLHTSRLSAFGFTAEAKYLGYTEYQVNEQLDGRTCPVCRLMHGKVFKVSDARNLLNTVVRSKDPALLKALQPWPKQTKENLDSMAQMSGPEFVTRGWHVPPYHPMCRGLLAKATVKIPLPDIGQPLEELPEVTPATVEDFEQFDVKLTPSKVAQWNTIMQTPPAEVLAKLSATTPDSLLASIQGKDDPKATLGLVNLSVTSTGVNVELKTKIQDSLYSIVQDLYFRKDKSLFVGLVEFHPKDVGKFKTVMRNMYGLAAGTSMERISLVTGEGLGGYAFAKYGFSLNKRQWGILKTQIKAKIETGKLTFPVVEQKALTAILASDDPNNIWALSDLPLAGKTLLDGITWPASLDLSDQEAITRFLAYLG